MPALSDVWKIPFFIGKNAIALNMCTGYVGYMYLYVVSQKHISLIATYCNDEWSISVLNEWH
jgi:hypothetical protein